MAEDKNNKQLQAVAIKYDPGEVAPKIIATGKGKVAEKIIETAKENDVALHKDSKVANTLSKLDIGEYIPPELYEVVAEILVFVDDCEKLKGRMMNGK